MLFLGPNMASETDELDDLIERVLRGDSHALRSLLIRLQPYFVQKIFDRFAHLAAQHSDILDEAESLLFEWSVAPRARELLPKGETLGTLAFRLVSQVARQRSRQQIHDARLAVALRAEAGKASVEPPAAGFGSGAIVALILALPDTHREVLLAEAGSQLGEGPSLAEALGVKPGAARMRLQRARAVLLRALRESGLSELLPELSIDAETADG
jgi:DNA-directed RNA polymerase specialized sigma24 family protein